ncbi:MAG TPA: helix-turn-helix domain-containing protein [Novosphingobium sp.]|nr:helix-turn-helix domain-containing protein [Novosphingobium sp.]
MEKATAYGNAAAYPAIDPLVDLSLIASEYRADHWVGQAPTIFPGLEVVAIDAAPRLGSIEERPLAAGTIFAIRSAPIEVSYAPRGRGGVAAGHIAAHLTLVLLVEGGAHVSHRQRRCQLAAGDLCLIDEVQPFQLTGTSESRLLLLRLPRALVLGRCPDLENLTCLAMPGAESVVALLSQTMQFLYERGQELGETQQIAALNALIGMLAAAIDATSQTDTPPWRVQKACDYIELHLGDPQLCADLVATAQRISRRRLDQLLQMAMGQSITGLIWSRRLQRAAADLRDPRWRHAAIAQIAFSNGFEDAAHFARAFKRRFQRTPGQWRGDHAKAGQA